MWHRADYEFQAHRALLRNGSILWKSELDMTASGLCADIAIDEGVQWEWHISINSSGVACVKYSCN